MRPLAVVITLTLIACSSPSHDAPDAAGPSGRPDAAGPCGPVPQECWKNGVVVVDPPGFDPDCTRNECWCNPDGEWEIAICDNFPEYDAAWPDAGSDAGSDAGVCGAVPLECGCTVAEEPASLEDCCASVTCFCAAGEWLEALCDLPPKIDAGLADAG